DGYLYATTVNDVRVVDVRSVNQPTLIATETIASSNVARVRAVATRDDAVFVGEWSGLHSFQLSPDVLAPDVRAASARVEFFHVAVGDTSDYELSVINDGTAPLVGTIELEGAAFSVDAETLELAAGTGSEASSALTISYTPSGTGTDTGRLIIRSDDPDQAEYEIPLVGNGLGVQVGDRVPEIAAAMVGGGEWRAIERIGQIQVLSYFATHCSECRPEFTLLEDKIWQEYENQGVQVIGIDRTPVGSGNVKFVDEFVEDTRITFPVGFDLSISFDLLKGSTPETSSPSSVHLVIDRDGNVAHLTGIYEDDEGINDIAPVLEQLLAAP
ncbi:MAG: redoxin domain-containing protein, partial [Myxococcota bacterium]